jgi:hypothetical protein
VTHNCSVFQQSHEMLVFYSQRHLLTVSSSQFSLDIRHHFICDCIEENRVALEFIGTNDQLADILTKALGRDQFCELRSRLGVIDVQKMSKA